MWQILTLCSVLTLASSAAVGPNNAAYPPTKYAVQQPPLDTPWTYDLGTNPWPEYPRPQMQRSDWRSLNGIWRYRNASSFHEPVPHGESLSHEVLIPSCLESALSGIQGDYTIYSWFSHSFQVPSEWKSRAILLNFGAVDYEATVYVNGQKVDSNRGGYGSFTIDISDNVYFDRSNELLVFVYDPTDSEDIVIPIGKQTLRPSHIFYTPCSGIWQSVWIEAAPANNYITQLDINGDMNGQVSIMAHTSTRGQDTVSVTIYERGRPESVLGTNTLNANYPKTFNLAKAPELWSPDSPKLYGVAVKLGQDTVKSYIGFRTVSSAEIDGVRRPLLNGKFIFPWGTLDQGYWPDGIYTPPNREAMLYDLQILKAAGFNMLRKHIKIEPALFYTACDEIGLLVWQDMPSPRPLQNYHLPNCTSMPYLPNSTEQADFTAQLQTMVHQHKSYPSIFAWTIYNEGWGQPLDALDGYFPEHALVDVVRALDSTRIIVATSGWHDHGAGDVIDTHTYASPKCGTPFYKIPSSPYDPTRIAFQGEFGGIGHNVSTSHLWALPAAIATINQTYELNADLDVYNYRSHQLLLELREQVSLFACSGAVWTQTTDVEGELNGLLTYDRRVLRIDLDLWRRDAQALYDAAEARGGGKYSVAEPVEFTARAGRWV